MGLPIEITSFGGDSPKYLSHIPGGVCRYCGCTDERACNPPCYWIDDDHTICSAVACVDRFFADKAAIVQRLLKLCRAGAL